MSDRVLFVLCCLVFLIVFAVLVAPAFQHATEPARVQPDLTHLRQLSIALLSYEAEHGFLPAAMIKDPKSGILRSWRVEILPYLDCELLYLKYKVDEPWDSPTNRKLWDQMPDCFAYADRGQDTLLYVEDYPKGETNYLAVVGDTTLWPPEGRRVSTRRTRRSVSSVLLLGVEQSGIKWTEPRDLAIDEAARMLSSPESYPKSSFKDGFFRIRRKNYNHGFITPVCLSNGSRRRIPKLTETSAISFLSEYLDWESLVYGESSNDSNRFGAVETKSYLKWPRILVGSLIGMCLLAVLREFWRSINDRATKMKQHN